MKLESEFSADPSLFFQPRGALFAVDERTERFLFSSENAASFAGITRNEELFGQTVRDVLGRQLTHALRNAESMPTLDRRRHHIGQFGVSGVTCDVTVFRAAGALILEVLPRVGEHDPTAYDVIKDVDVLTDALLMTTEPAGALSRFVALMRTMSGFHCVCLSRRTGRREDILAVSGRTHLSEAVCEATEQFHTLHDVNAAGVGLSGLDGRDVPPLDLSALRFPSEDHLFSCRRVGVEACASVGFRCGGRLLGTLKFLHEKPRSPNKRTQFAIAHLAPLIGQRLNRLG